MQTVVIQARYAVIRRTDQPLGRGIGGMVRAVFSALPWYRGGGNARPLFLGQRRRMDFGA